MGPYGPEKPCRVPVGHAFLLFSESRLVRSNEKIIEVCIDQSLILEGMTDLPGIENRADYQNIVVIRHGPKERLEVAVTEHGQCDLLLVSGQA